MRIRILFMASSFQRQLTLPSGKTVVREFKPGEVMWSDAHSHDIGENIGDTETLALIRRLRPLRCD